MLDSKMQVVPRTTNSVANWKTLGVDDGVSTVLVQEWDLVRDALYALQGIPSSLIRLESQARPPQKRGPNNPSVRLLSTSPASIAALLKPLIEAGRVRQQLDRFARGKAGPENSSLSADWEVGTGRGLVMQAFGGALQTVLLCQTAALDRIGRSVAERRGGGKLGASNGDANRTGEKKEAGDEQRVPTKQSAGAGDERTVGNGAAASGVGVNLPDGPKGVTRRRRLDSLFAAADGIAESGGRDSAQDREGVQINSSSSVVRSSQLVSSGAGVGMRAKASDATLLSEGQQVLSDPLNGPAKSSGAPNGSSDASKPSSDGGDGPSDGERTLMSGSVGDITLLELLLHSEALRTQLHVLARLCKRLGMSDGLGVGEAGVDGASVGGANLLSRLFDEVMVRARCSLSFLGCLDFDRWILSWMGDRGSILRLSPLHLTPASVCVGKQPNESH